MSTASVFDTSDVEQAVCLLESSLAASFGWQPVTGNTSNRARNTVALRMIRQTDTLRDIIKSGDSALSQTLLEQTEHLDDVQRRCAELRDRISAEAAKTTQKKLDAVARREHHSRSLAHSELLAAELSGLRSRRDQLQRQQEQLKAQLQSKQKATKMKMQTYHQATRVKFTGEDGDTVYAVFTDVSERAGEPNSTVPLEFSRCAKEDLVCQADEVWARVGAAVQHSAATNGLKK